jgi:hypothetical protein
VLGAYLLWQVTTLPVVSVLILEHFRRRRAFEISASAVEPMG